MRLKSKFGSTLLFKLTNVTLLSPKTAQSFSINMQVALLGFLKQLSFSLRSLHCGLVLESLYLVFLANLVEDAFIVSMLTCAEELVTANWSLNSVMRRNISLTYRTTHVNSY